MAFAWNPPCGCRTFCTRCGACALCNADEVCETSDDGVTVNRRHRNHAWKTDTQVTATLNDDGPIKGNGEETSMAWDMHSSEREA